VSPPQPPFDSEALDDAKKIQLHICESKAVDIEATIIGSYDDDLPDSEYRKGLGRLMERVVGDRDVDVVIVDRLDTLAQDRTTLRDLRELMREGGARLATAS
jgi:DNA invertase Pin-like site-specific DNA recombinase